MLKYLMITIINLIFGFRNWLIENRTKNNNMWLLTLLRLNFILDIQFEQFVIEKMSSTVESENRKSKSVSFYDFLYVGRFLLKLIFLRLNESDLRPHWMFFIAIANVLFCIITEFAQAISNLTNEIHFIASILGLWYCIVKSLAVFKTCEIVMRKGELKQFLNEMNDIFPKIVNSHGEFKLRKILKQFTISMWFYVFTFIVLILVFTLMNFIRVESKVVNGIHWKFDFVYPMLLPFDPYQHWIFELVHIIQQSAAYFTIFAINASDALLYCLINYFCIHYDCLAQEISQTKTQNRETEQQMIVHIVEQHKKYIM